MSKDLLSEAQQVTVDLVCALSPEERRILTEQFGVFKHRIQTDFARSWHNWLPENLHPAEKSRKEHTRTIVQSAIHCAIAKGRSDADADLVLNSAALILAGVEPGGKEQAA